MAAKPEPAARRRPGPLRRKLRELYFGATAEALRFQARLLVLDVVLIAFFVASPVLERTPLVLTIDYVIAVALAVDLAARAWAYEGFLRWIARPIVIADIIVLLSLLFPHFGVNLAFLRALRAFSLVNSSFFWMLINRGKWAETSVQEATKATVNLVIFVFIMTGFVHTLFAGRSDIQSYLDSLYFTVSSLTTTGYGDIVLPGPWGRVLSIFIMVIGISLFVRLAQVALRPSKVVHPCPGCGLRRHELDAVHCKACGHLLRIAHDNE
ncbi:MAG: potassium channel family protein [Hyphomonadaceae bacterium]